MGTLPPMPDLRQSRQRLRCACHCIQLGMLSCLHQVGENQLENFCWQVCEWTHPLFNQPTCLGTRGISLHLSLFLSFFKVCYHLAAILF